MQREVQVFPLGNMALSPWAAGGFRLPSLRRGENMKRNELKSLRTKGVEELEKTLKEKKLKLMEIRASMSVSKNKNLKQVKIQRHFISQVATILTEKRLAEEINSKEKKREGKEEESLDKVQNNSKS